MSVTAQKPKETGLYHQKYIPWHSAKLYAWMREHPEKGLELLRFDYKQGYANWKWESVTKARLRAMDMLEVRPSEIAEVIEGLGLTLREAEVCRYMVEGYSEQEMAVDLGISVRTIRRLKVLIQDKASRVYPDCKLKRHKRMDKLRHDNNTNTDKLGHGSQTHDPRQMGPKNIYKVPCPGDMRQKSESITGNEL